MSICKFSSDYLIETFTLVDNLFINEYLPYATENQIKVYIYGLYLCSFPLERDNNLESFSKITNIPEDEIIETFAFWEETGLLQIISKTPFEVKYLCLKGTKQPPKKYKSEKYYDFNLQLQEMFPNRPLVQNEYVLLYEIIDSYKIQPDAMLMIVQYCIGLKGLTVRFPYIIAVVKNWATEGIKTVEDVEGRLSEYEAQDENMKAVLNALSRKGGADLDEKQQLLKWTKNWGFDISSIVFAAKTLKSNRSFKKLDNVLDEYYRMSIFTEKEMQQYVEHREMLFNITIKINSTISVFYETLDHIIETYTSPWVAKGYDEDALLTIAHYCFLSNIRTLSGMNNYVNRFFKLGLISKESINEYIEAKIKSDESIKNVLTATGSSRGVTANDREFYKVWCMDWGFTDDVILYAAELSSSTHFPIQYMNKILSAWKETKLFTLDEIKKDKSSTPVSAAKGAKRIEPNFTAREYTKEELAATFDRLTNFDETDI